MDSRYVNSQLNMSEPGICAGPIMPYSGQTRDKLKSETEKVKWHTILYISGGNGVVQIDFEDFIALPGRIFYIEKYKIWSWIRVNGIKGIIVQFTDTFYNHIYTGNPKLKSDQTLIGEIPPFIIMSREEEFQWRFVFDLIVSETKQGGKNSKEITCLLLKIIILMYRRYIKSDVGVFDSGHKNQLLNEFRKLVNNRFISMRSSKDYADRLNISPNYLNALCQEFYFKTVSEIIRERTILEAKRMLAHSSLTVSQISYKLGFRDNSYFGRYFKKSVGMTPRSYRGLGNKTEK